MRKTNLLIDELEAQDAARSAHPELADNPEWIELCRCRIVQIMKDKEEEDSKNDNELTADIYVEMPDVLEALHEYAAGRMSLDNLCGRLEYLRQEAEIVCYNRLIDERDNNV